MSAADLTCSDERRRQLVRDRNLNGVDYVDVVGSHLCVHFLTGIPPQFLPKKKGAALTPEEKAAAIVRIVIRGGRRVTGIRVIDIDPDEASSKYEESCLGIELDKEGDWSTYTICFVETEDGRPTEASLQSLDPRYACLDFTFKIDCQAEIDCVRSASASLSIGLPPRSRIWRRTTPHSANLFSTGSRSRCRSGASATSPTSE